MIYRISIAVLTYVILGFSNPIFADVNDDLRNSLINRNFWDAKSSLEKGANPNGTIDGKKNGTPYLIYAAGQNLWSFVHLLLEAKVQSNVRDIDNNTIVHLAARRDLDSVTMVINENIDLSILNNFGLSAIEEAMQERNWNIVKCLLENHFDRLGLSVDQIQNIGNLAKKEEQLTVHKVISSKLEILGIFITPINETKIETKKDDDNAVFKKILSNMANFRYIKNN